MSLLGKPWTIVGLKDWQLDAMERLREMDLADMAALKAKKAKKHKGSKK